LARPEWREARHLLKGSPLFMPFGPWGGGHRSAKKWLTLLETTQARQEITAASGPSTRQLSKISQPVLAYYGSRSTLLKSYNGLQQWLPDCYARIENEAGHFFPLSRPKSFIDNIRGFFETMDARSNRQKITAVKSYCEVGAIDGKGTNSKEVVA